MKDLNMVKCLLETLGFDYCEQQTYYPQFDKYDTNIVILKDNVYTMICFDENGEAYRMSENGIIKEV